MDRLLRTSCKILLGVVMALMTGLVYLSLFGFFSVYDDEGYNVAMIRLVSGGIPLYTGQYSFYGPVGFLSKAFVLGALGVPITHETIRLGVLAVWIMSSALLAATIWNLSGNWTITLGGLIVIGAHLFALRYCPGHPEDLVVLFLSLAVFIASAEPPWLTENLRVAMLGFIGALLAGTKINVGVLYLLGLGMWILACLPRQKLRVLAPLFIVVATAAPALLMHRSLSEEWPLVLLSTISILLTSSAFLLLPTPPRYGLKQLVVCAGSTVLGLAVIVLAAMLHGSHFKDLVEGVVLTAAKQPNVFLKPLLFGRATVPVIAIFGTVSIFQLLRVMPCFGTRQRDLPSVLKVTLALLALAFAALRLVEYYIPLIGPVCWLLVFPDGRTATPSRSRNARMFVAAAAIFQVLQVFPIIGTQTSWSTLLLSVCCLVLLYDGIAELSQRRARITKPIKFAVSLVGGLTLSLMFIRAGIQWTSYTHAPSLGFNNSNLIRIPLAEKASFDWLVASTQRYCDTVVTQPGMNSFLLWPKSSGDRMPTSPVLLPGWPLMLTVDQERQIIANLGRSSNICAVYNQRLSNWWTKDGTQLTQSSLAHQPLVSYIHNLHSIRKVGDYEIRASDAVAAKWMDDYLVNGTRSIDGDRQAVGIPADLLTPSENAEIIFEFQVSRGGPLLSVQLAGDVSAPTEPVVYVSRNGSLMMHTAVGTEWAALNPIRVTDGLWHELSFAHAKEGWQISLDGVPTGQASELFGAQNPARYLQLGPAFVANCSDLGRGWVQFFGKFRDVRVRHASSSEARRTVSKS